MEFVKTYKELNVYLLSRQMSMEIFNQTKGFPKEEVFSLTDQIRRSSRSVGAQIAEAWGKRRYEKHFVSKITDAIGEQLETQHWIEVAMDCSYISLENSKWLLEQYEIIGKMLNSMIHKSSFFCKIS